MTQKERPNIPQIDANWREGMKDVSAMPTGFQEKPHKKCKRAHSIIVQREDIANILGNEISAVFEGIKRESAPNCNPITNAITP